MTFRVVLNNFLKSVFFAVRTRGKLSAACPGAWGSVGRQAMCWAVKGVVQRNRWGEDPDLPPWASTCNVYKYLPALVCSKLACVDVSTCPGGSFQGTPVYCALLFPSFWALLRVPVGNALGGEKLYCAISLLCLLTLWGLPPPVPRTGQMVLKGFWVLERMQMCGFV